MRRITMRDFRWLSVPKSYEKNHREVLVHVDPCLTVIQGPLLLAVSDESFSFDATMSVPESNTFCGLCVYHLDTTYTAVGLSQDTLQIQSSIGGFVNNSIIPYTIGSHEARWRLKRHGSHMEISLIPEDGNKPIPLSSFTLPASEDSISFGFYFCNHTQQRHAMRLHTITYLKDSADTIA